MTSEIGLYEREPLTLTGTTVRPSRHVTRSHFRIAFRPGRYTVRTSERLFGRIPQPSAVTVPTSRYARVTFRIDTGIR